MTSPTCLVNGGSTASGVDVAAGAAVNIQLADLAGVTSWSITCVSTDETQSASAVTASLVINNTEQDADFTAPNSLGTALRFKSVVNNGRTNGLVDPSLTAYFLIHTLVNGRRVGAFNEETEGGASGSLIKFNSAIRNQTVFNVVVFGAVGNGIHDDKPAIQAAIDACVAAGGGTVYFPAGAYFCNSQLVGADNVHLEGAGDPCTTITFVGATGSFPVDATLLATGCIQYTGSLTVLPTLAVGAAVDATSLTLASAPTLAANDVVVVYDETNKSFSGWRNEYRAGEFARVLGVVGSTVSLQTRLHAAYAAAATITAANGDGTLATLRTLSVALFTAYPAPGLVAPTGGSSLAALETFLNGTVADLTTHGLTFASATATDQATSDTRANEIKSVLNTSASKRKVYKLAPVRVSIRGMKVIGDGTTSRVTVAIARATGCSFDDVTFTGSPISCLTLETVYDSDCTNVRALDTSDPAPGLNYGISLLGCQRIGLSECHLVASRHGLTIGGGNSVASTVSVPCRDIEITDSFIDSTGAGQVVGADMHGDCENVHYVNCVLPHGAHIAGDHTSITGCPDIGSGTSENEAIHATELLGLDHKIEGNTIRARAAVTSTYGLVNVGYPGSMQYMVRAGGVLRVANNKIDAGAYGCNLIYVYMTSTCTQFDVHVEIVGNEVTGLSATPTPTRIFVRADTAVGFKSVAVDGNRSPYGVGVRLEGVNAEVVSVCKNTLLKSGAEGILKLGNATPIRTTETCTVQGNTIIGSTSCGMELHGESQSWSVLICNGGNTSINNAQVHGGSSSQDSSIYAANWAVATVKQNVIGDTQTVQTQTRMWACDTTALLIFDDNTRVGTMLAVNNTATKMIAGYIDRSEGIEAYAIAADFPLAGAWRIGDRVWDRAPVAGGTAGWICTTAGSGAGATWKTFGAIAA